MKRIIEMMCLLIMCMILTGCAMGADPNANVEVVDPNGEPVIVIDEECSKKEERFDINGNLVGYDGGIQKKVLLLAHEGVDLTRFFAPLGR